MGLLRATLAVLVALLATYIYWPPPDLTKSVRQWKSKGVYYDYKGFKIFYYHRVNPSGTSKPLLILHSFPASSFVWRDVVNGLKESFTSIVVPDLLGLGFSDKPQSYNYTVRKQTNIVVSLLQDIGINQIHVIGHDYGGTIAQELLAQVKEGVININVLSVALLNGGIIPATHQPLLVQRLFWQPHPVLRFLIKHAVSWPLFKSRFPILFGPNSEPSLENLTDIYSILMYKFGHYVLPDVIQFFHERYIHERRWTGALKNTNIPIALIYGVEDRVNTENFFLKQYEETFENSIIYKLQAGHYPQMEDLEGFLKAYLLFLKST